MDRVCCCTTGMTRAPVARMTSGSAATNSATAARTRPMSSVVQRSSNCQVLARLPAKFPKLLPESCNPVLHLRISLRVRHDDSDLPRSGWPAAPTPPRQEVILRAKRQQIPAASFDPTERISRTPILLLPTRMGRKLIHTRPSAECGALSRSRTTLPLPRYSPRPRSPEGASEISD